MGIAMNKTKLYVKREHS